MDNPSQVARFERDKLLKWWAQSFPIGVRRIVVGFRDDAGFCRKLQTLETLKLPGYAARHRGRGTRRRRCDSRIDCDVATEASGTVTGRYPGSPGVRAKRPAGRGGRRRRSGFASATTARSPTSCPRRRGEPLVRAAAIWAASAAASSGGRGSSVKRIKVPTEPTAAAPWTNRGQTRRDKLGTGGGGAPALRAETPVAGVVQGWGGGARVGRVDGGGRGGSREPARGGRIFGRGGGRRGGCRNRGGFDASGGANPSASDAPAGTVDDLNHHRRDDHHSHHHHSHLQRAPATRVAVHWAGAEPRRSTTTTGGVAGRSAARPLFPAPGLCSISTGSISRSSRARGLGIR